MAYATVADVQSRMTRTLSTTEQSVCEYLLDDAAILIDAYKSTASADAKKTVSCRMVIRAIGDGSDGVPMGATQGQMSALGYYQSWSITGGGTVGELYLSKTDRQLLGGSNEIGSYSPVMELVPEVTP